MTDTDLIERLEAAQENSSAFWCKTCGRVYLSPPGKVLAAGNDWNCTGYIDVGTPDECIAALRARLPDRSE